MASDSSSVFGEKVNMFSFSPPSNYSRKSTAPFAYYGSAFAAGILRAEPLRRGEDFSSLADTFYSTGVIKAPYYWFFRGLLPPRMEESFLRPGALLETSLVGRYFVAEEILSVVC